ncbi:MAG TPA: lysylphosphatidylglycerol synthase domain-containing protein, partial [Candidatus Nanopelagicales bacterium]|nr:lysylphosphatidylglycerol synthase domain-containing protein [Candidatus Nanopelagicales bacterium]
LVLSIVGSIAVSIWSMERVPGAAWQPAVIGLVPWVIGKYLLCPLRWHSLSVAGQTRRWHIRAYAESELIGLASPAHIGADVWRMHRLKDTGMNRPCAVAEVGLDRLVGTLGVAVFVVVSGATLPPQVLMLAAGIAVALLVVGLVLRRLRPGLLAARPMPRPRVLFKGIVISMGYQLTIMGLVIGSVAAMGQQVDPLALLGIFGASQLAGAVPGVHGASPREGALVVGLASLGVSWTAALGAVALAAVLAWLPALLLGGVCLGMRRLRPAAVAA